ncbi:putative zinc binding dehydrogenase [Phaeomoniella chlamydospora]|uniref:Putative zinc binding dehydrogenase n=1 Tax=Phaeomoniella chlamydospora TaxID=158046 RepID=A0A0G2GZQ1_PHACM|nr:putative zinc binding dehydrogenase [Phaeomoniella chlamydospora]
MVKSGIFKTRLPCTGSHEGAGIVVAVGSSQTSNWSIGDRVMAVIERNKCGNCPSCTGPENYRQYCPYVEHGGVTTDGAFAEYMIADGRECIKLPDVIAFDTAAPLACAGSTIYRALLQTSAQPGEWIAIIGSGGGLGHLGIQFGKAMGLKIIGVDAKPSGLELSKASGADVVLDASSFSKEALVQKVAEATSTTHLGVGHHSGVSSAIVLSEHDSATSLACAITHIHGTVVQIAQPTNVSVPFRELVFRDIRLKGSLMCSREEAKEMLKFVTEKKIKVEGKRYHGLKELPQLMKDVHEKKLKGKGIIIVDSELK